MAYLWSDPRIDLRTSNRESVPTCSVRQQLLQKSIVLSHQVSLDVVSFLPCLYVKLELVIQEWISYICLSIVYVSVLSF